MKKSCWMFLFALSLSVTSHARLGETFDECVERYGETTGELDENGQGVITFKKNGLNILTHFYSSYCDLIKYSSGSSLAKIDCGTAAYLLEVNGRSQKWLQTTPKIKTAAEEREEAEKEKNSRNRRETKTKKPSYWSKEKKTLVSTSEKEQRIPALYEWISENEKFEAIFNTRSGQLEIKSIRGVDLRKEILIEGL